MREMLSLGLIEAEKAIAAGIEAATRLNRPMAFAVADVGAEMIATARMDGANPRILRHSVRKAYTAALMCRHTLSFKRDLEERERLHDIVLAAGQWSVALVIVLGLAGGFFVARRVLRRVDAMTETSRTIMAGDLSGRLPKNYTLFGQVTKGMDVVDQIVAAPRDGRDLPNEPVAMTGVTIQDD